MDRFPFRAHGRRAAMAVVFLLVGAMVLSGPGTGCVSFIAESTLTSTDFCFIFDCQNGILGGTIDPCPGTGVANQIGEQPLFTDCQNLRGP